MKTTGCCSRKLGLAVIGTCVCMLVACSGPVFAMEGERAPELSRGKAAAILTALFHHDVSDAAGMRMYAIDGGIEGRSIASVAPGRTANAAERMKVVDFAKSLVYEGGFYPREIYQLLGYDNPDAAKVSRVFRQLDAAAGKRPAPWEAAGRIGRSGMSGSSDHWAMAPGESGEQDMSSPGTLAYLPALAVAYSAYQADGREAAAQLAILKDDDIRAAPVARSAVSLLMRALLFRRHDKDEWLRHAAADSADADTEHDLRAVRVKDWRYLRGEECAMGRLERAVFLWYKGDDYETTMEEGRRRLRSREGLAYLAALAAATYGMESLPKRLIASGADDRQLLELVNDLHDLATSEAVLRVDPEQK